MEPPRRCNSLQSPFESIEKKKSVVILRSIRKFHLVGDVGTFLTILFSLRFIVNLFRVTFVFLFC